MKTPDYPGFKSAMPAFGGQLGRDEIIAVLTYVKSLWEGKTKLGIAIRESQALVSEGGPVPAGRELVAHLVNADEERGRHEY